MNTDLIHSLTGDFEAHSQQTETGVEYWLARDLQYLLGYAKWENFQLVIGKAKIACEVSGHEVADHFPDVRKMVGHLMARYLASDFRLPDDELEVFPFCIAQKVLKIAGEPVFHTRFGLLGVGFKIAGEAVYQVCIHASRSSVTFSAIRASSSRASAFSTSSSSFSTSSCSLKSSSLRSSPLATPT